MWVADSWEGGVKFLQTPRLCCRWGGLHEDTGRDEGSHVYKSAGHTSMQEGEQCLDGCYIEVFQVLDELVYFDVVQVCVETIVYQEVDDVCGLEDDLFVVEVWILKEGGRLGVDELAFKSVLVGYPDGGIVEYLPWNYHGLR